MKGRYEGGTVRETGQLSSLKIRKEVGDIEEKMVSGLKGNACLFFPFYTRNDKINLKRWREA